MNENFWYDFLAGWIGGCAGIIAGHPMDTLKVRQQIFRGRLTAVKCLTNTFRYEGFRGFYKGMGFPLISSGALNSLFFGVYGNTLRWMSDDQKKPSYGEVYLAGCLGGAAQLIIGSPVELVKIKMQMQTGDQGFWGSGEAKRAFYKGPFACIADIYKNRKLAGCYYGVTSMAARDVCSYGFYMVLYEAVLRNLGTNEHNASPVALILSGAIAGGISWMVVVPVDVIKSRIQADDPLNPKYKGIWDCLKKSYRAEGSRVFFRGSLMVLLRALPTNGAIFLGYATSLNLLRKNTIFEKQEYLNN